MRPLLAVFLIGACASSGWMEGDAVDTEVRRVLASGTGAEMGLATAGGLYRVPAGMLDAERKDLLQALLRAERIGWEVGWIPSAPVAIPMADAGPVIAAYPSPQVLEIAYPDCTLHVRRHVLGQTSLAYSVNLMDRRTGTDRGWTYHMGVSATEEVDAAWRALEEAAARGARHIIDVSPWLDAWHPLWALREVGVDYRRLDP
jgi:hypothetical protein